MGYSKSGKHFYVKLLSIVLIISMLTMFIYMPTLADDYSPDKLLTSSDIDCSCTSVIKLVQEILNNQGYDCGVADGDAGPNTISAINKYKTDNNIEANSVIDDTLIDLLDIRYAAGNMTRLDRFYQALSNDDISSYYECVYDDNGRLINKNCKKGGDITYTYYYDDSGQLIEEDYIAGTHYVKTYEYDENGNLLKDVETNIDYGSVISNTYTYDSNGLQISRDNHVSSDSGEFDWHYFYEYDAEGNLIEEITKKGDSKSIYATMTYSYENGHCINATYSEGDIYGHSYLYDDQGNMIADINNIVTELYLYDENEVLLIEANISTEKFESLSAEKETTTDATNTTGTTVSGVQYNTFDYKDFARNPNNYQYEQLTFTGKVIQVMYGDTVHQARIAMDSDSDQMIYITFTDGNCPFGKLLEDDIVTVYGTGGGETTYQTIFGSSVTLPWIIALDEMVLIE